MLKDPFTISSIIIAISFVFILIFNQKMKSKIIKLSFLVICLIYLILILIFDNNFIYELLKTSITYIWYPNYSLFVATILISILILLYTLFKENLSIKRKIINYILFSILFSLYIIFKRLNIDTTLYNSLYSINSLIVLRIASITFITWLLLTIVFKIIDRSSYEK